MPIDQTIRGLALEIDASVDPAPEAQPLLEYRFIDSASTQTIIARIKGISQSTGRGELVFETNAGAETTTQRMLIDSNGNVGIGTVNPEVRLDVVGEARFSGPLSIEGRLTAASFAGDGAGLSNVTPADNSVSSAKLALDAASLSKVTDGKMVISGGNVGVGTENPAAKLDVAGGAKFKGPLQVQGALTVSGVTTIGGDVTVSGRLTAVSLAGDAAELRNVTPTDRSVTNAKLAHDAASLRKVTDGKMVISGGNVGVGTENPAAKLDVAGDAKFKGPLQVQGTLTVSGEARIDAVGVGGNGRIGKIGIDDANGKNTIMIGGPQGAGRIGVGGNSSRGQVAIFDENTNFTINLGGTEGAARIGLGGNGSIGTIDVFDAATKHTIRIGSAQGPGRIGLGGNGSDGVIDVFDANSKQTIKINGKTGKVEVSNADCAEEFDILQTEQIEPGMVMVLGEEGKLERSQKAYDRRVVGVISGAGDYKPGIVLDKQQSDKIRKPIALLGKVYCRVDTQYGAIEVGDQLTTSFTPGHAMKAEDPLKAFGAVIGKALRPLAQGQGLIPIVIALQ
jgi:hypothetical protein